MEKVIGFIGSGNMGQAMIGGIIESGLVESKNIIVSDLDKKNLIIFQENIGLRLQQIR